MFQLLMEIKEVWPSCFSLISFESCSSAASVEQFGGKCSLAKTIRMQTIIIINNIMLNTKQGNVTLWKQEAGLNKHPFSKLIGLSVEVTAANFHNINNVS